MIDLIFDTETTGLANLKGSPKDKNQPHLVQFAALLTEGERIISQVSLIVNPLATISEGAAKTHGLTEDIVGMFGVMEGTVLTLFDDMLLAADRLVAHNLNFDFFVMKVAYYRHREALPDFSSKKRFCTMLGSMYICNLPGKYGNPKWPKLQEAYRHLVDEKGFEGAHDALADVIACHKILQKLEEK